MRDSPRTWPSIRWSLLRTDVLASVCMRSIYPPRVYISSEQTSTMTDTSHQHHGHGHTHHRHGAHASPSEAKALDPVCGMTVDPATTPHKHDHHGETYFFCSGGC